MVRWATRVSSAPGVEATAVRVAEIPGIEVKNGGIVAAGTLVSVSEGVGVALDAGRAVAGAAVVAVGRKVAVGSVEVAVQAVNRSTNKVTDKVRVNLNSSSHLIG